MKIQYLAIIFLIIILPMTLVLTMYNQSQINNLDLQLKYNSYLSDATHNAVKAFELNTVNNSYSEVADSLKRDVEAAVNVFLNSMASSLGTSGATPEAISEYVPAVLFTLYDGYYIYAPARSEILVEGTVQKEAIDGTMTEVIVAKSKDEPDYDFSHIVKPYVYYTMRYNPENSSQTDFIVNYTLDNYITVYGKINGEYVTKSGYLVQVESGKIKLADQKYVTVDINKEKLLAVLKRDILSYASIHSSELINPSVNKINNLFNKQNLEELERYINFEVEGVYRTSLIANMGQTLLDNILNGRYATASENIDLADIPVSKIDEVFESQEDYITVSNTEKIEKVIDCFTVKYDGKEITDDEAKSYYVKALQFSNWVNSSSNPMSSIEAQDARDSKGNALEVFTGKTQKIFNTRSGDNNPEVITSDFIQHKNEVIRESIQSNLTASIARYNQNFFGLKHGYDLKMPVLNATEWGSITNNVTMVTFMQGMIIGNKVFNDYSIVSSEQNKEVVDMNELYYFNRKSSGTTYYHRFDCPNLYKELDKSNADIVAYNTIEYELYTTKDDNDNIRYQMGDAIRRELFQVEVNEYGQEIITATLKPGGITSLLADYDCLVNCNYTPQTVTNDKLKLAKYTAIARERNEHYKVNGYMDSYEIEYKKKNIVLTPSTTEYTSGSVKVSVISDMNSLKYYLEGNKNNVLNWPMTNGKFADLEIKNNTTLYVYSDEDPTRVASIPITNIDKTKPTGVSIKALNRKANSFDLEVTAKDNESSISKYVITVQQKNNTNNKPYTQTITTSDQKVTFNLKDRMADTTYVCKVEAYDMAGNITSKSLNVTTTK